MDLFFVLSGFLISGLLFSEYQRTKEIDFWRFILRRGFKIWPAFYVFLAVSLPFAMMLERQLGRRLGWGHFLTVVAFLQSYIPPPTLLSHTWSLAIEEHFYLLLPLLLMCLIRCMRSLSLIPVIFIGVAVFCFAARILWPHSSPEQFATHARIDGLFAGVFLGYLFHFNPELFGRLRGHGSLAVAAVCIAPAFFPVGTHPWMMTIGLTLLYIGFALLVAWSLHRTLHGCRAIAFIGVYSYSIYLWHYPLGLIFQSAWDSGLGFAGYLGASLFVGILMSELVEIPALKWRERCIPAGSRNGNNAAPERRWPLVLVLRDSGTPLPPTTASDR